MKKCVFAVSDHYITTVGNGIMRREDRKTPCGFREKPKTQSSKQKFSKGKFGFFINGVKQ